MTKSCAAWAMFAWLALDGTTLFAANNPQVESAKRLGTPAAVNSSAAPIASSANNSPANTDAVRLEIAQPLRIEQVTGAPEPRVNWTTVIISLLAAAVGAAGALIVGILGRKGLISSLTQSSNAAELKDLQAKLDRFYGPYLQRSEQNRLMAAELKSHQPHPEKFRTLTLLLDPDWRKRLSKSEQTIIGEIENDIALNKLIHEQAGLVDSEILTYLARAGAHFRLMQLAYDGKLENLPERFERYVYPYQLDKVLKLEIDRITTRCDQLRQNATKMLKPMASLQVPPELGLPEWPNITRPSHTK